MCAWPRLLLHTSGPGKLPRTPPRPRPPSRLLFITLPSALPWKSNQGREHTAGVSCHSPGRPVRQLRRIRGRAVHHERALKRPLSWRLGGEIWRRESLGDFRREKCSLSVTVLLEVSSSPPPLHNFSYKRCTVQFWRGNFNPKRKILTDTVSFPPKSFLLIGMKRPCCPPLT